MPMLDEEALLNVYNCSAKRYKELDYNGIPLCERNYTKENNQTITLKLREAGFLKILESITALFFYDEPVDELDALVPTIRTDTIFTELTIFVRSSNKYQYKYFLKKTIKRLKRFSHFPHELIRFHIGPIIKNKKLLEIAKIMRAKRASRTIPQVFHPAFR